MRFRLPAGKTALPERSTACFRLDHQVELANDFVGDAFESAQRQPDSEDLQIP